MRNVGIILSVVTLQTTSYLRKSSQLVVNQIAQRPSKKNNVVDCYSACNLLPDAYIDTIMSIDLFEINTFLSMFCVVPRDIAEYLTRKDIPDHSHIGLCG